MESLLAKERVISNRDTVDAELLPLIEAFPYIALSSETLCSLRERPLPASKLSEAACSVSLEHVHIPGPSGAPKVRLAVYRPADAADRLPTILHMHGGGFVSGSLEGVEPRHRELAVALSCTVVSIDYRLAPETQFPGAIEDCYAALGWLARNGVDLGISETIGLMGESAGGGLAAALALLARDRDEHRVAFQHLIYPMLDDRTGVKAPMFGEEFLWTGNDNRFGWSAMLGAAFGGPDVSPYAAPARASDLSKLPPTFIMTGALDLFADEDVDYGRRLVAAGVSTEIHVFPGAFHGFDLATWTKVGQAARQCSLGALARELHRPTAGVLPQTKSTKIGEPTDG